MRDIQKNILNCFQNHNRICKPRKVDFIESNPTIDDFRFELHCCTLSTNRGAYLDALSQYSNRFDFLVDRAGWSLIDSTDKMQHISHIRNIIMRIRRITNEVVARFVRDYPNILGRLLRYNEENKDAFPADLTDLSLILQLSLLKRPGVSLELGCGMSTIIFASLIEMGLIKKHYVVEESGPWKDMVARFLKSEFDAEVLNKIVFEDVAIRTATIKNPIGNIPGQPKAFKTSVYKLSREIEPPEFIYVDAAPSEGARYEGGESIINMLEKKPMILIDGRSMALSFLLESIPFPITAHHNYFFSTGLDAMNRTIRLPSLTDQCSAVVYERGAMG